MTLLDAARAVRQNAHAPYSKFRVGAAIRTDSGQVFVGCNVENVAYPEGTCAEAGAIAAMCAAGERDVAEVAVIADSPQPVSPCGGCRQKLAEFGGGDVPVSPSPVGRECLGEPDTWPVVELDGTQGAGARMLVNIIECDVDSLSIGDPVEIVWDHVNDEMTTPRFRPRR